MTRSATRDPAFRARTGLPRFFEVALALIAFVVLLPILAGCAALVMFTSKGPILFRQQRVGRGGRPFEMLKFRTMVERQDTDEARVTARGDHRITRAGRWLRRSKLDELPELVNIVRGDMSFVGPRPELADFVDPSDPRWRAVLSARPGLTDPMTLELRDEEALLEGMPQEQRLPFYRDHLLPYKLAGQARYLARRTARSDLLVLLRTGFFVLWPASAPMPTLEQVRSASGRSEP